MLFVSRSGEGVEVMARPRPREGTHLALSPSQKSLVVGGVMVLLHERGLTERDIAEVFRVSQRTVHYWIAKLTKRGAA